MNILEELKKKLSDIEIQNLAMEGCSPTFTVSDIMDLIDSVELAQNLRNACTDTIYRQAAIELAMQYCPDDDGTCSKADEDMRNLLDELEELPSAQPEQKWTPCSDPSDLPKDKRLWITREIYGARIVYDVVWDMTEWSDDVSDVVAYMPYWEPEPYAEW